jgi:hypothetical protein
MYWVTPVPGGGLTFSPDGRTATLKMEHVPIINQPRWPALDAEIRPAFMSFRMVWKVSDTPANIDNPNKWFRFTGHAATVQMEVSVEVPSIGFSWKSDPLEKSECKFALMGEESNGKYYTPA